MFIGSFLGHYDVKFPKSIGLVKIDEKIREINVALPRMTTNWVLVITTFIFIFGNNQRDNKFSAVDWKLMKKFVKWNGIL